MVESNSLSMLADLLRGTGAQPTISQDRLAPSTIYDLQYRLIVNACAFEMHAGGDWANRRISAARLKLLQFVAIRPWLLPVVRSWSQSQETPQASLQVSQYLRRGFLGDAMHESIVEFLSARDVLVPAGSHLAAGKNVLIFNRLYKESLREDFFPGERAILSQLKNIKITNKMLEGW